MYGVGGLLSVVVYIVLFLACLYMVMQVRKAMEQFQKFEKLFRALREANTKVRFGITGLKDKLVFQETLLDDLQAQVDILLHPNKTEVENGNINTNSHDSADSVRNR